MNTHPVVERAAAAQALRHAVDVIQRWTTRRPQRHNPLGLSPTDVWLLDRLATHAPARMSDLATWQDVDRSTMSVQVARLVNRGLAHRTTDPIDRRAVAVELTEEGRAALVAQRGQGIALIDAAVVDWDAHDLSEFSRYLTRFAQSLDDAIERSR